MEHGNVNYGSIGSARLSDTLAQAERLADCDRIAERLREAIARVTELSTRANNIGNRLYGEMGESLAKAHPPRPVRSGFIGTIEDLADDLHDVIGHVETNLARIGGVVGH